MPQPLSPQGWPWRPVARHTRAWSVSSRLVSTGRWLGPEGVRHLLRVVEPAEHVVVEQPEARAAGTRGSSALPVMPVVRNTGAIGSHMHTTVVTLPAMSADTVACVCSVAVSMLDS